MKIRRAVPGLLTRVAAVGALAAAAGLAGALATGPAASASPVAGKAAVARSPRWRMQAPPSPSGWINPTFDDVSCSSRSACLAIANSNNEERGPRQFAETWNGSHWTVRRVPHSRLVSLYAVTCRRARWCVAVGASGSSDADGGPVADLWNGSAWKQAKPPAPAGASVIAALVTVACSSTRACTAIGEYTKGAAAPRLLAERWNGSAWKIQKIQPLPAPTPGSGLLNAVACPTADACRAVGSDKRGLISEVWQGSSWQIRPVPAPSGASDADLTAISCAAPDSCEAVGSYYRKRGTIQLPLAEAWNGSRWRVQALSSVSGATPTGLDAVSCLSATDCEAAGQAGPRRQAGLLEKWNGTAWSVQEFVQPAGNTWTGLTGISCETGPFCEAVGYHGSADLSHLLALRYSAAADATRARSFTGTGCR
jgi:hypothetical protein